MIFLKLFLIRSPCSFRDETRSILYIHLSLNWDVHFILNFDLHCRVHIYNYLPISLFCLSFLGAYTSNFKAKIHVCPTAQTYAFFPWYFQKCHMKPSAKCNIIMQGPAARWHKWQSTWCEVQFTLILMMLANVWWLEGSLHLVNIKLCVCSCIPCCCTLKRLPNIDQKLWLIVCLSNIIQINKWDSWVAILTCMN